MWTKTAKSTHYKICTLSGDNLGGTDDSCARKGGSVAATWKPGTWQSNEEASTGSRSPSTGITDMALGRGLGGRHPSARTKRPVLAPWVVLFHTGPPTTWP